MPSKSSKISPPAVTPPVVMPEVTQPARKPRGPMSEEAKASMKAKRAANKIAQSAAPSTLPPPTPQALAAYHQAPAPEKRKRKSKEAVIDLTVGVNPALPEVVKAKRQKKQPASETEMAGDFQSRSEDRVQNQGRIIELLSNLNTVFNIIAASGGMIDYRAWQDAEVDDDIPQSSSLDQD